MAARRRLGAALGGVVACAALGLCAVWLLRPPAGPDVILISIDSLRPDHLGCYGYGRATSPVIDGLAREGVLFEAATSSTTWTLPAHAALFTGLPDSVHGCTGTNRRLAPERTTLAERFRAAGYRTAGFFAGPLLHPAFGFAQGFDDYVDCTSYPERSQGLEPGGEPHALHYLSHQDVTNAKVHEALRAWLARNRGGPRFLFIHLWDVHFDFIPPAPYDTLFDPGYAGGLDGRGLVRFLGGPRPGTLSDRDLAHLVALYDAEIRWTDHTLGLILEEIRKQAGGGEPVIVVASDHGEAFFEHGRFGHRQSLFEEELRVPLIFHAPGRIAKGMRVGRPVRLIDVAPTLCALAGIEPLEDALGRSLVPLLGGSAPAWEDELAVAELYQADGGIALFALRTAGWKHMTDYRNSTEAFYDLERDPGETRPLPPGEEPIPFDRLWDLRAGIIKFLEGAARKLAAPSSSRELPLPPMTERQLKSLQYLR